MTEWTDEEKTKLKDWWSDHSASVIADSIGKSKNAVIGMAHRMQLPTKKVVHAGGRPKNPRPKREPVIHFLDRPYPHLEVTVIEEPRPESAVPLLNASWGQCRAVIDSCGAPDGLAMVCGMPIVEGQNLSFCAYHLEKFTVKGSR